jgi:hypothetical protein
VGNGKARKAKEAAAKRQKEADSRLNRHAARATIIGTGVGLISLLLAYFAFWGIGGSSSSVTVETPRPAEVNPVADPDLSPRLERVDLLARNGMSQDESGVELIVHNAGRGRSVISRAEIEVVKVYELPLCFTQGSLPISEHYGAQLPIGAQPGDIVELPLHQQVGPNRADRFAIHLSAKGKGQGAKGSIPGLYLFEFKVSLVHDGQAKALPMGSALVSLPAVPVSSEFLLLDGLETVNGYFNPDGRPVREAWADQMPCWRANAKVAILARETDATMSAELARTLGSVTLPSFSEVEPQG